MATDDAVRLADDSRPRGTASTPNRSRTGADEADPAASRRRDRVVVIALGDVHGLYAPVFAAALDVPDAAAILQVGDLTAGKPGRETHVDGDPETLRALPAPLIWIHGNHEQWNLFEGPPGRAASRLPGTHLWPGTLAVVPGSGIGVVGLPGNYAPTWYPQPKPFPGDRVRHFNRDDVEAMARHPYPNILLMHESFRGQAPGRIGVMGIAVLARLVAQLRPAVVLTGHHHLFGVAWHGPTLAISLPPAWDGYARLEFERSGALVDWEFRPAPSRPGAAPSAAEPVPASTSDPAPAPPARRSTPAWVPVAAPAAHRRPVPRPSPASAVEGGRRVGP